LAANKAYVDDMSILDTGESIAGVVETGVGDKLFTGDNDRLVIKPRPGFLSIQ
jgi:hypothetical protein